MENRESEVRSVSSANSQTSRDIGSDTADRRIESAEKRFERLKEQIQQQSSTAITTAIPPPTTMKSRLKSIFTIRKKAAIQPIMELPRNTKKSIIKDKDCGSMRDFISHERIPKKYAIYIDKQCYDARHLLEWLSHDRNLRIPHTNVKVTPAQYQRIEKKASAFREFLINEVQPQEFVFRQRNPMYHPTISNDGRFVAFDNLNEKVEVWDLLNKKKLAELDLFTNGEVSWMQWNDDGTQLKALVKIRRSSRLHVVWRVWNTQTWKLDSSISFIYYNWETGVPTDYVIHQTKDIDYMAVITSKKARRSSNFETLSTTNSVEVWDLTHNQKLLERSFKQPEIIYDVALCEDKIALNMGSTIIVMNTKVEQPDKTILANVQDMKWNCNGTLLAIMEPISEGGTEVRKTMVTILNPTTSQKLLQYKTSMNPSLSWHPTKENLFALSHSTSHRVIDIFDTSMKKIQRIVVGSEQGNSWLNQLQWTKNGSQITTTFHRNFMIYMWDIDALLQGGANIKTYEKHIHNGRNYKVREGKQGGKYILVGKEKKKVYI